MLSLTLTIVAVVVTFLYHLIKFYIEDRFHVIGLVILYCCLVQFVWRLGLRSLTLPKYDVFVIHVYTYCCRMDSFKSEENNDRLDMDVFDISSDESSSVVERKMKNPLSLRNCQRQKRSTNEESVNVDLNRKESDKRRDLIMLDISMDTDSDGSDNPDESPASSGQESHVEGTTSTDMNPKSNVERTDSNVFDVSTDTDSNLSDDFTQASCASHAARVSLFSWSKQKRLSADSKDDDNDGGRRDVSVASADNVTMSKMKRSKVGELSKRKRFTKNENTLIKYFNNPSPPSSSELIEKKEIQVADVPQHELVIAGSNVKFPVRPYPCQFAVMNIVSFSFDIDF